MRSLGDLRWLNEYIGIRHLHGGRNPREGVDCYGLVKLVYDQEYGIVLPDWVTDEFDLRGRSQIIGSVVCSGDFTEMEEPHDGSFVICYRSRAAHHVGLHYGRGVLHCQRGIGSVYEPLSRFQEQFSKVVFGEWHP